MCIRDRQYDDMAGVWKPAGALERLSIEAGGALSLIHIFLMALFAVGFKNRETVTSKGTAPGSMICVNVRNMPLPSM